MLALKEKSNIFIDNVFDEVSDFASQNIKGFEWLSYHSEGREFSENFQIICVFSTVSELMKALKNGDADTICDNIQMRLKNVGVVIGDIKEHISFDTDEFI